MKIFKEWKRIFPRLIMVSILALTIMAMIVPAQAVSAASEKGGSPYSAMFTSLKTQFGRNKEQMTVMKHYQKTITKRLNLLDRKGINSATMQTMVDKFNTSYYAAEDAFVSAKNLFATHPGFDDKYKVTNDELAHASVSKARSYLSIYLSNIRNCKSMVDGANARFNALNRGE
jgi:hypothetical protein